MALTLKQSLKLHLSANRYTLTDFAKYTKIAPSTISQILSGKRNPKYESAVKLAKAANDLSGLNDFYTWQDFKEISK